MVRRVATGLLALLAMWVSPALADAATTRTSLTGLKGVGVVVEDISPDAQRDGLLEAALVTDVELRLRQAGILILARHEALSEPGIPFLYLNINTLKTRDGLYAFCIKLSVVQRVILVRDPRISEVATTWSGTGYVGTIGAATLRSLRDNVRDSIDEFINAYLAVNPRR